MAGAPRERERQPLRKWLSPTARVVLTVAVTWFILRGVGLTVDELRGSWDALAPPKPLPLAAATLLFLGASVVTCLIWGGMVREMGGTRLSPRDSITIFLLANLGRYVPGKIWAIVGVAALAKGKGIPLAVSTASAAVIQGVSLLAAGLIGLGAFARGPEPPSPWWMAGAGLAIVGLLLLVAVPGLFRRAVALWFRAARAGDGPPRGLTAASLVRWLFQVGAVWVAIGASFWLFAASLGAELPAARAGSAFAAAHVMGYVALFAPAGLGVREGVLVVVLGPSLGEGPATALAIAARLWMTLADVIPAAVLWALHRRARRRVVPEQG